MAAPVTKTPYELSAELFGGAKNSYDDLMQTGVMTNINDYINPYYDQVLNAVLGRMGTAHNQQLNMIGDNASRAGAFGGSRHGVAEGVATGEYNRNVGDVSAQLKQQAFDQATKLSLSDIANKHAATQGATQLGSTYYNVGNDLTDRQMQQGSIQQQLLQAILGGASAEFDEYMQQPYQVIDMFSALLGADPRANQVQQEQQSTPGLFDYLALAAQAVSGSNLGG